MSLLAMWSYVEADFRRDYGIRLCEALTKMSWREFQALLYGLSPWGAVASHYDQIAKRERLRAQQQHPEAAREGADAFWAHLTAIKRPKA